LLPAVDAWLEQADVLIGGAPRFDPLTAERTFVVSAADYGEAVLLPELLRRLEREAPKVKLRISTQPLPLDAALEKGELDLAWTPKQPSARTVVWTRLFDETFTFVVRKGHPVTKRPFTLDRFCALRHLALAPVGRSNSNPIDELLARLGRKREVVATVPSFLVVPSLLLTSDVGVILPRRIFHAAAQRFQSHGFTLHHAWHERMRKDAGHAWFRQVVVEVSKTV
jgi:DNA-binding transcriptional LysR family regulator